MSTDPTPLTSQAAESGSLRYDGSLITYTSRHYGSFSIALSEVAVIGEFTTDNGPFIDDWFLVLVPRTGGEWFEASMYAAGGEAFRAQLSSALGFPVAGRLAASTDFTSRIVWPHALADKPLFIFCKVAGSGLFRRLKLFLLPEISHGLSPEVLSGIKTKHPPDVHP